MDNKSELEQFAAKFLQMYYDEGLFSDRTKLSMFYRDHSALTFENLKFQGVTEITSKYNQLPIMRFQEASRDVQPIAPAGSVLINIIGQIMYDGTDHPQTFNQVFILAPEGTQWYISNDIFRFVYTAHYEPPKP